MQDYQVIMRLIDKIETGLPQIKQRSISALLSKISIGIVDPQSLPKFKKLPGVLLTWINDNSTRCEYLYKVLTILNYFTKSQDGLVLLQQYEATSFFKQLRHFLLSQNSKQDQYINMLESMIKQLIPLHPQSPSHSQMNTSNIPLQQSMVSQKAREKQALERKSRAVQKEGINLSWLVPKDHLGKKEEDQLYSLFMQLRHGKRQLQLQWLKRIHDIVKYWGYKWYRFKADLVGEIMDQFPKSKLKWLIIEIVRSILSGINSSHRQLKSGQWDLIDLNSVKPSSKAETELVTITLKNQIFTSIHSAALLQDILSYQFDEKRMDQINEWLIILPFKYSPNYFLAGLERQTKGVKKDVNLTIINQQIQFYSDNYPSCRQKISQIIQTIPQNWGLQPTDFPKLVNYLQEAQKHKSYGFIAKYDSNWQLGSNLHIIAEVINNLQLGVRGIDHSTKKRQLLKLYINCLLTLGVAVQKQDPLMAFYPRMKKIIFDISQNDQLRAELMQEILFVINSHSPIKYGSKSFICSELALMIFGEDTLFQKMFQQSFQDEQSLANWLEVVKRIVLTNGLEGLDKYGVILYCLSYHKKQQIKQLSKYLTEKIGKQGKLRIKLCRMFSRSQEQKIKITSELFKQNSQNIFQQLASNPPMQPLNKKQLKIGVQTIQNCIKIIFNNSLQEGVRLSGAQQLLESVQRMQLNQNLIDLLINIAKNITKILGSPQNFTNNIISLLVQISAVITNRIQVNNVLSLAKIVQILQLQHNSKTIQILLKMIYVQCFKNPFSQQLQIHFISLLYPHLQYVPLPVYQIYHPKNQKLSQMPNTKKEQINMPIYKQTRQIQHFAEWMILKTINGQKATLDQTIIEIVQKQIGEIIHASKGFASLHFLTYLFNYIVSHSIQIPDKITDYTSPLLSTLLSKDLAPFNSEPTAQLLSLLGTRRTKQLNNLLANASLGTWKLFIVGKMSNVDPSIIQTLLKGLLGLHYGRQAALTLRSLLPHLKSTELSSFSQSLIVSSCTKYIRQDTDYTLRKISLSVLTELYGSRNLPIQGEAELFASLTAIVTEQLLPSQLMVFAINLIKTIVEQDPRVMEQVSVLKLLFSKLIGLATYQDTYRLLQASVLQLLRVVLSMGWTDLLAGADVTDIALPILGLIQKQVLFKSSQLKSLSSALDLLYFNCETQSDLPKYLLTSTRLLTQLLLAFDINLQGQGKDDFLESISRIWLRLSMSQEDLFVYKVSQIVSQTSASLMQILSKHLSCGKIEYLKMLGWTTVIWSKNRQHLQDEYGQKISNIILTSQQPHLIKMILPFSLKSKHIFISSALLSELIKEAITVVQARLIKDIKDKRKKTKVYVLQQKQAMVLQKVFGFVSALFYWNGEGRLEGGDGIRKIMALLQKFYLAGVWQQSIMKHFLRATTNMAISMPLSDSVAASLAQNGSLVQQIGSCIVRCQSVDANSKLALRLAASLAHIESVRAQFLRSRLLDELSAHLIKDQQRGQLNLEYTMDTIQLFLAFSTYKDSNAKIIGDKRLLEVFLRVLRMGKLSMLQEKIVRLLANLACFKHNKPTFMSCKDLHKIILGLLQDPETPYRPLILSFLYNLLYKNSAALKLYRRPQVIELVKSFQRDDIGLALLQALEGEQA